MHDRADRFKARGIVEYVMREGTGIVVNADGDLHIQIILCGLKLVHQLVAGRITSTRSSTQTITLLQRADLLQVPQKANPETDPYSRRCVRRHQKVTH